MTDSLVQVEKALRLFYLDHGIEITSREYLIRWISLVASRFFYSVEGMFCHASTHREIQCRFRQDLANEAQIVGLCAPTLPHFDVQEIARIDVDRCSLNLDLTAYGRALLRQLPSGECEQQVSPQFEDPEEALFT